MLEEFVTKYCQWIDSEIGMLTQSLLSETYPAQWVPQVRAKLAQLAAAKVELYNVYKAYMESEEEFDD